MKIKYLHIFRGYLLAVEHNPVYTIGIRTKMYDSEEDEKKLRNLGAEFHRYVRSLQCLSFIWKIKAKISWNWKLGTIFLHSNNSCHYNKVILKFPLELFLAFVNFVRFENNYNVQNFPWRIDHVPRSRSACRLSHFRSPQHFLQTSRCAKVCRQFGTGKE